MNKQPLIVGLALIASTPFSATARDRYQPVGIGVASGKTAYHPIKPSDRVVLPGLRPASAELMARTCRERYPRSLGKSVDLIANKAIPKILSEDGAFARARGIYAELRYVQSNPDFGLVAKRNASQHDLYSRPVGQKAPLMVQVKTLSGGPEAYGRAMVKDYRARYFVVPDDHVEGIRRHWESVAQREQSAGRLEQVGQAYRQRNRVKAMGVTLTQLESEMRQGGRYLLREQSARYVSYGATIVLVLAPVAVDLWKHGQLTNQGFVRLAHGVVLTGTGVGVDLVLSQIATGALRGTIKGNLITGSALLVADFGFAVWEYGGMEAFSNPEFYMRAGGSIGGLALGFAFGVPVATQVTVIASPTGPWAPVIGGAAGIIVGGAAGFVGQIGGRSATRVVMNAVLPDIVAKQDLEPVRQALDKVESEIAKLSNGA